MQNNLIVRMSNGIGNQLFMYASAYGIAKKLGANPKLISDIWVSIIKNFIYV